jgi:ribonuclease HII
VGRVAGQASGPGKPSPLAQLRAKAGADLSEAALRRLVVGLESDSRAGARALADECSRRLERSREDRRRVRRLFALRRRLRAQGMRWIAGVDEVGVGPLAGPVVAAAVVLPDAIRLPGLDDSKKLSAKARERLSREIREQADAWSIGVVAPQEIDRVNILQATLAAMRRAVLGLPARCRPNHVLVDARTIPGVVARQTPLVHGDANDGSIAAASIVAKVYRDELMAALHDRHPEYGFAQNMGYGTPAHLDALSARGPCPSHRWSFAPVAAAARGSARVRSAPP